MVAGIALALAALSAWYTGVAAGFFWLALLLLERRRGLLLSGGLAIVLVLPAAWVSYEAATAPDNLVGIKGDKELATVRRTIGAADWRGWFVPGDFRSPDFERSSRYGEEFVHCHYLGFILIVAAGVAVVRRRGEAFLVAGGAAGLVAAMGPVVVLDGEPVVLDGFALALPWLIVEQLPGLASLSLLYRLAMAPALALAVLAARASDRWGPAVGLAVLLELRLVSPAAGLPHHEPTPPEPALEWLRAAPAGAVMNFPVVGGRRYLYEQTMHNKPVAGSLNFPNNASSKRVWSALLAAGDGELLEDAARVGRAEELRYLVVHQDAEARPDQHDTAVRRLRGVLEPAASSGDIEVYALW